MANRDIKEFGQKTIRQAEQIADFYYRRDRRSQELMPRLLRQLILYTQLLEQAGDTITEYAGQMSVWVKTLNKLTQAVGGQDEILAADLLHFEVVPALDNWVKTS